MGVWNRLVASLLTCLCIGLLGCGGNAPAPPPVNPYATNSGGNSSPPPANPAPPTTSANPFGQPPAGSSSNSFGPSPANSKGTSTPTATSTGEKPGDSSVAGVTPAVGPAGLPAKPEVKPLPPTRPSPTQPAPPKKEEMIKEEPTRKDDSSRSKADTPTKPNLPEVPEESVTDADSSQPEMKPETDNPEPENKAEAATPAESSESSWTLETDPAPAGSFAAAGAKVAFKLPSLGAIGPDFVESTRLRVVFPVTPGPYVALGLNDDKKQFREIWSLNDKKKIGQVRNIELGSSKAQTISPDGKYFAAKPQWESSITLFSIAQNKPVSPIKLNGNAPKVLAFAGKTRLIVEDSKELHVYSVPEFKPSKVIKLGGWKADDGWAVSPGGRYFVAVTRKGASAGLAIYDLDSGETAAVVPLQGKGECQGVAFSTDGKQLAVWLAGDTPVLQIWNTKGGASSGQYDLAEAAEQIAPRENYQGGRLEWFPDQRHLLVGGRAVFDTRLAKIVSSIEKQPIYPVRVMTSNQLAIARDNQLVTVDLEKTFKENEPAAESSTEPATASSQPEVKPADRSAVVQIALEDVEWNVKLGKPPEPIKATGRGVEIPQGAIYMGCLSQSPHGLGYVMFTSSPLEANDQGLPTGPAGTKSWLEPLDLKNGAKQKVIPLPFLALMMSVSQDGTRVCTQNADGLERLDVWATRDGSHQAALTPYVDAPPGPEQRVQYAEFIDVLTLLTAASGRLTLWDIGANKAQYEMEIGELRPELSPARDYVAVTDSRQRVIYLLNTKTGQPAGIVALSDLAGDLASACSFHPEGRFFAALTRRVDGGELRIVDLQDGTIKKQIPLPVSGQVIQWVGSDFVLVDGAALVSISRECVVWNYSLPDGIHLRDTPDQRHWYIAADPARSNVYVVRGVDMPEESAVQRIGVANPRGKLLLQPGQAIDLDIVVDDPEGESGFADQIKALLTDRYLSARMKVASGVPMVLKIRDSGESAWSVSLHHEGKSVWSHEIDKSEGSSAILDFEPPKHAFSSGADRGAGQSQLGIRGVQ